MIIKFALNNDDKNVINKEAVFSLTTDIKIRGDVDLVSPVLIMKGIRYASDYNYCSLVLPDRERYYFISDVDNIGGDLFRLTLELDPLETYKDFALNSKARFNRNLKTGDFVKSGFEEAATKTISKYASEKGLPDGNTMVLSTLGDS